MFSSFYSVFVHIFFSLVLIILMNEQLFVSVLILVFVLDNITAIMSFFQNYWGRVRRLHTCNMYIVQ